ncbi:DUF4342 domain-containing protein [Clostridium sp. LIBA-8841]|uniref:DUF4342 domain-containing protein n=1 Tax=Clostridium sp. LIBA-8841 TaxID=2987530 RepID=UPI002AC563ED|nr:DUF4342 domain-containing protein [Clostridium sp. LIBA-8841]MDZ5253672.1 DUF4342 domain-containing protein [Clostridium sp. LIBA-8841]
MERNEMINTLVRKANISPEEAQEVLEKCNWDLLDAIVYLERRGKVENNEVTAITVVEVMEGKQEEKEDKKKQDEKYGGIGEIVGRMFKFIGKVIRKGTKNFLEIRKEDQKPIRISLTISILFLIFLSVPTIVLLIIGLFCGYKYSISGPNFNYEGVNNIFEEVSKSADHIKKDFKEGYEK